MIKWRFASFLLVFFCLGSGASFSGLAQDAGVRAGNKRALSGDEILMHFKLDQWRIKGQSHLGYAIDVRSRPDGEIFGTNLSGGGSLYGRWEINPREDIICLKWEKVSGLANGCYLLIQTGPISYQLDNPSTGENVWQFVVVSQP